MSIDINKPVEKGHDMVLNNPDGTQELGTDKEFAKRKEAGELSGLHTNDPVAAHNESVEKVEESNDRSDDAEAPKENDVDKNRDDQKTQPQNGERLNDEQDNKSAEQRTAGEVEQTETNRDKTETDQPERDENDKQPA
jgi:hypothetical protein